MDARRTPSATGREADGGLRNGGEGGAAAARPSEPKREELPGLLHPGGISRPRGKQEADEDFHHHGVDGFEGEGRGGVQAFLLQEGVGDGADDDVVGPPGVGATFEVIEAELGLELLVLLLDRPTLMDKGHEVAERCPGGQVDEVVLGHARPVLGALAEQPDLRQGPSARPVVRRGDPDRGTDRRAVGLVGEVPRDPLPCGRGPRIGQRLHGDRGGGVGAERGAGAALPGGRDGARSAPVGAADKDGQRPRNAQAIRQLQAVQGGAERGRIAIAGIAEDGGQVDARGADLPKQGEREFPLLLEAHRRGDPGVGTPRRIAGPALGQIQRRAEQPRAGAGPEGRGHGHLAVADFAQAARVPVVRRRPTGRPSWESRCRRAARCRGVRAPARAAPATSTRRTTGRG